MIPLTLAAIADITGARLGPFAGPAALVRSVVIDSRQAGPGALFAALPGERADGHDFAVAAVEKGAVAVLASRPVGVPALIAPDVPAALAALARAVIDALPGLTIAGITGSVGKTTTKDLAAQLIERLGPTVAPYGSFNNEIGHPLTVLRVTGETRYLVLELSARGRRAHRPALRDRAAPARRGAVRGARPHRRIRRAGGGSPGQGGTARRPAARRGRAAERRRPAGDGDGGADGGPGGDVRHGPAGHGARGRRHPGRRWPGAASPWSPRRGRAVCSCAYWARTTW